MAMIVCPKCGMEFSESMGECFGCGYVIEKPATPTQQTPIKKEVTLPPTETVKIKPPAPKKPEPIVNSGLMYCPDCGKTISKTANSCPKCGHQFKEIKPYKKPFYRRTWFYGLTFLCCFPICLFLLWTDEEETLKTKLIVTGIIIAFIIIGVAIRPSGVDRTTDPDKAAVTTTAPKEVDPLESLPISQRNAVKSARNYLDFKAYSKEGLINQLSSEYADQFPVEDATFAANYLEEHNEVDWNEQAAKSAKSYLNFKAYSRNGLINQLTSEFGERFTNEQAVYAVDYLESNNLVDWKEQAAKSAKSYLSMFSYSKADLIQQLTSDYGERFTQEEAEYAATAVGF